ncbi:hypothetical protein SK128_003210 [Halocaridina rubra]|uniref:Centrosomal protein of 290kDa coiled-coil region domain-containing protein n=1 Tax=Halocaridina rubra TaxID=373956 RepID=A0AAN8WQ25_HALRR
MLLRQQYAGAVPLTEQERLVDLMKILQQERNSLRTKLECAQHDKSEAKIALSQLIVKQEAIDDLKNTLLCENRIKHITSWCNKLEEMKLKNVELEEKVRCLEETKTLYELRLQGKETQLEELQTQLSDMERLRMSEQLMWEEQETELNKAFEKYDLHKQTTLLEEKTLTLRNIPDYSKPLSKQLEETMDVLCIKNALIEKLQRKLEAVKNELVTKKREIKEKDIAIIAREQVVKEFRYKGQCLDIKSQAAGAYKVEKGDPTKIVPSQEEEGIKVVVNGLKERLQLSQEAVKHYQDLLAKAHIEQENLTAIHKNEVEQMNQDREETRAKARELMLQLNNIPTRDHGQSALSQAQLMQIHDLEDTVKMLELQLEDTRNELLVAQSKVAKLERELTVSNREHFEQKEHVEVSIQVRAQQHQRELDRLSVDMTSLRRERDNLQQEVMLLKEAANRTPSVILRTLVEKLRDQLIEKEKQVAKLTFAVQEMKERVLQSNCESKGTELVDVDKETHSTNRIIESLKCELEEVHKAKEDLERKINRQMESLNSEREQTKNENENLKEELKNLKMQNLKIEKQMLQQKKTNVMLKQRLEDMEGSSPVSIARAIQHLTEKLEKINGAEEVEESAKQKMKSKEEVARWDERKKLRTLIDKLKARVKELQNSLEISEKKLATSRDLLNRIEKDKLSLQLKLNSISKVSTEKMCGVCLKTLNTVDMGTDSVILENSSTYHTNSSICKTFKEVNARTSADSKLETDTGKRDSVISPSSVRKIIHDSSESEIRLRAQLKKSSEDRQKLETKLKGAVEEVAALRKNLQQKEEGEEERMIASRSIAKSKSVSGAAVILEYESRIMSLEEDVRQKSRLLAHVKQVVREAAAREDTLIRNKDLLLQKVTLLESVSEDTPAALLVHELRQAKLTITRLQRHIDQFQVKP